MGRIAVALVLGGLVLLAGAGVASAESCSPAMCAGMSPVCWQAYQQIMVHKDKRVGSVDKCRDLAGDLGGQGAWITVSDLTPKQALCACEAAFWSMDSDAQGLPDIDDTTEEKDNTADDDE